MASFDKISSEELTQVIDCVADIDEYTPVPKSESTDSDGSYQPKVVLVTGGAGTAIDISKHFINTYIPHNLYSSVSC